MVGDKGAGQKALYSALSTSDMVMPRRLAVSWLTSHVRRQPLSCQSLLTSRNLRRCFQLVHQLRHLVLSASSEVARGVNWYCVRLTAHQWLNPRSVADTAQCGTRHGALKIAQ